MVAQIAGSRKLRTGYGRGFTDPFEYEDQAVPMNKSDSTQSAVSTVAQLAISQQQLARWLSMPPSNKFVRLNRENK